MEDKSIIKILLIFCINTFLVMSCKEKQIDKPLLGLSTYLQENLDNKFYHENRSISDIKYATFYGAMSDSLVINSLGITLYEVHQKNVTDRMGYIIISDSIKSFYKIHLNDDLSRPVYLSSEMQEIVLLNKSMQEVNYRFQELEYFLNSSKYLKNSTLEISALDSIFMFTKQLTKIKTSQDIDSIYNYLLDFAITQRKFILNPRKQKSIENTKTILKERLKFKNSILMYSNGWGIKYIEINPLHNELVVGDTSIPNVDDLLRYQNSNYDKLAKGNFYKLKVVYIYPN
jgi:hypothetical protein